MLAPAGARGISLSRRGICLGLGLLALGGAPTQRTGSYMGRAWLLIGESSRASEFLGKHVRDRALARLIAQAAEGRLRAATETQVPRELVMAHPHLLLMLEHYERAAEAAASGSPGRFAQHASSARDEEQIFRSILNQLGLPLPAGRP
jgi:hypothetical protein